MPTSRVIVILYAFTATANVMATAAGPPSLAWSTAPLLVPLLAGIALFAAAEDGHRPPRWLLAGLVLAAVADVMSLAGVTALRVIVLTGGLVCYASAAVAARRRPGIEWGLGLMLIALSATLLAVRLSNSAGSSIPEVVPTLAYVIGQLLVVTGWIRQPPRTAADVPQPRAETQELIRR